MVAYQNECMLWAGGISKVLLLFKNQMSSDYICWETGMSGFGGKRMMNLFLDALRTRKPENIQMDMPQRVLDTGV